MRRLTIAAMLLLAGCGGGTPASNTTTPPDAAPPANSVAAAPAAPVPARATCPEWHPPEDGEDYGLMLESPLPVPADFRDVASASTTVMTVQGLSGTPVCVRLGWITEASDFWLSADKRFLGFTRNGYESFGHILVDRSGKGQEIETGEMPVFSQDRTLFAAAQVDPSGWGGLEGIGVWEVHPSGVTELARIVKDVPDGEWEVDEVGPGRCVALSYTARESGDGDKGALSSAPYRLSPRDGKWVLERNGACAREAR
ncbi:hypothetical protein [Sphingomonas sp. G-3-2-10]|uniref:hypothetical protein n=1 Tax=Sphingomonas sp. G-3-2-10 TaxID=2728838 RepID=UPI00146BDB4B|nr:hypothetical protein [Sphingomonas sp. G-3-2-10]NML06341.1 hypothetical protein [Sphingomonas sp. G-3-2-10]